MEVKKNKDKELMKFLGKIAITVAVGAVLTPPVAVFLASYAYGTAKCMEYLVEEEDKEACRFISDCAKDIVLGEAVGSVLNKTFSVNPSSLSSQTTKLLGNKAGKEIATNGASLTSETLIVAGELISDGQKTYKVVKGVKGHFEKAGKVVEIIKHQIHLDKGINYLEDCEVCRA